MSKILKNTTGSPLFIADTGTTLPILPATFTIPPEDYLTWAASSDIVGPVGTGDVIVNDGSSDLSPSEGMELIDGIWNKQIVEFEGDDDHFFGNFTTVPGSDFNFVSIVVAASTEMRLHAVQVSCRRAGVFTILEGATPIGVGRTGAANMNPRIEWKKQKKISAGTTLNINYEAPSDEIATDLSIYVDKALVNV